MGDGATVSRAEPRGDEQRSLDASFAVRGGCTQTWERGEKINL